MTYILVEEGEFNTNLIMTC